MATRFYFRDIASDLEVTANLDKAMLLAKGASVATAVTNYSGSSITVTKTSGGTAITWWSAPWNAVTVSGTITFNIWGIEANMSANAEWRISLAQADYFGNSLGTFVTGSSTTEMGTTLAAQNWATAPSSSRTFAAGDRVRVDMNVGPDSAISGGPYLCTFDYDGPTNAADGDSWIEFNETITEATRGSLLLPNRLQAPALRR